MCSCNKNKIKRTTPKTSNRLNSIVRKGTSKKPVAGLNFVSPRSIVKSTVTNQPIKLNQGGTTVKRANVVTPSKIKINR